MRYYSFVFCLSLGLVHSQDLSNLTLLQWLEILGETIQIREGDVQESDVNLFLFTRSNPNISLKLGLHSQDQLNTSKPTKFIIHGWLENHLVEWYREMKDELLKYEYFNVVQVDWNRVARSYYISSARNTQLVGTILGSFILKNEIPPKNVHLIGHSLGSHIAAFAGKMIKQRTGSKVGRISALDPAGPYFRLPVVTENERLSKEDAEIVDVIHTDGGYFGFDEPIGTLDIYMNGGRRRQPGCHDAEPMFDIYEILKNSLCSHARSHEYFVQSLNNGKIVCQRCATYMNLRNNTCSNSKTYIIVHQNISDSMTGICAVETEAAIPYFK